MAISFLSQSDDNSTSFLRPLSSELIFQGTSTDSLVDKTIFIQLGMFLDLTEPLPVYFDIPKYGYPLTFPSDTTPVIVNIKTSQYSYMWETVRVTFTRVSTTVFTITLQGLMIMDTNSLTDGFGIDNLRHITSNSRNNPLRLNGDTPAVYNRQKLLRLLVYIFDGTSPVDYGYNDVKFNSRFINQGLEYADAEFTNFDYFFNSPIVYGQQPGFSLNENRKIRFLVTGTMDAGGWVAIWEDTNPDNNNTPFKDINFSMVYFDMSGSLSAVYYYDNSAFVSGGGAVTTISGSNKYVDIIFNKDYFDKTKKYRVAFIPIKANDYSNTFVTDQLDVTDVLVPTAGDVITDLIENYSLNSNPFSHCITGVAPNERLKFTFCMGKQSYNDNLYTNSSFGTWAENFLSLKVYISDTFIPDKHALDSSNAELLANVLIIEDDTKYGGSIEIRVKPEWANTIKYITWVYEFNIQIDDSNSIIDTCYYQQHFSVADFITDDDIEFISIQDSEGNDLDKICGDSGIITVTFKNNMPSNSYDLFAYLEGSDGEEDPYTDGAGSFDKLNTIPIASMDSAFDSETKLATVKIDTAKLLYDKEYCIQLIANNQETATGECVESATMDIVLTRVSFSEHGLLVNIAYENISIAVIQVELIITILNKWGNSTQTLIFDTQNGNDPSSGQTTDFTSIGTTCNANIEVKIKTENNCNLFGSTNLMVTKLAVSSDSDTITLT